jgi:hypothetical protein
MGKIVKLIVVVAVVVFLWKKGLPFIQSYGFTVPGAKGELNTEGWGCVRQAESVRDLTAELLANARPNEPIQFIGKLRDEYADAGVLCQCQKPGCVQGKKVLGLLSGLINQMDDVSRIGEAQLSGARRLQEVDEVLDEAKAAARSAPR